MKMFGFGMKVPSLKNLVPTFTRAKTGTAAPEVSQAENNGNPNAAGASSVSSGPSDTRVMAQASMRNKFKLFRWSRAEGNRKEEKNSPESKYQVGGRVNLAFSQGMARLHAQHQPLNVPAATPSVESENTHAGETVPSQIAEIAHKENEVSGERHRSLFQRSTSLEALLQQPESEPENTNVRASFIQVSKEDSLRLQNLLRYSKQAILQNWNEKEFSPKDSQLFERVFNNTAQQILRDKNQETFSAQDLQDLQHRFMEFANDYLQNWKGGAVSGNDRQSQPEELVAAGAQGAHFDTERSFQQREGEEANETVSQDSHQEFVNVHSPVRADDTGEAEEYFSYQNNDSNSLSGECSVPSSSSGNVTQRIGGGDMAVICSKTKIVKPELLSALAEKFQAFLGMYLLEKSTGKEKLTETNLPDDRTDRAELLDRTIDEGLELVEKGDPLGEMVQDKNVQNKNVLNKGSATEVAVDELKNTLKRLSALAKEYIEFTNNFANNTDDSPGLKNKDSAQEKELAGMIAYHLLAEAVRDCYADAAKICDKHVKQADNGSEDKARLAALSGLFTELKRHHLAASATPAFHILSAEEEKRMMKVVPGMVEQRGGAAVNNAKALSLGIGFGTSKLAKGQASLEVESTEEFLLDDDGDQNRWDKINLTGKTAAILSFVGFSTAKVEGKLKVSGGTNYAESGSYKDQSKIVGRHKIESAYINKLWKSASPEAREWKNHYKQIQKYVKLLGSAANYQSASAPIYMNERKIAKGATNASVIHEFAERVHPELAEFMKDFYPPLGRPMAYTPMSVPAGGAGLRGKEGVCVTAVEGTLELSGKVEIPGLAKHTNGYMKFAAEAKGALVGRRKELDIDRLKPSHVLLSGAYTKDMRKSLDLWNAIETRSQKSDSRLKSKLALYNRGKDAIGKAVNDVATDKVVTKTIETGVEEASHRTATGAPAGGATEDNVVNNSNLDAPYDVAYFGPASDIPKSFLKTIVAPEEHLKTIVDALKAECEQLENDYNTLHQNAGLLYASSPNHASKPVKGQYKTLLEPAFKKINESVWIGGEKSGVKLADLVSSTSKRIEFLADSYDAISIALGSVGTHLEIVKARVAEMENPPLALVNAIEKADARYSTVNAALVRTELPMHEDTLHRHNTIAWAALSTKNEVEMQASLSVGIPPSLASGIFSDKLSSVIEDKTHIDLPDVNLTLDTSSLGISAGFVYRAQTANHQNLARTGDFREARLSLRAGIGPLTEVAVEKAAILALTKMRKDLYGATVTTEEIHALRDSIKTAASTFSLTNTSNLLLVWKDHKYSQAGDDAWRQQYFRIEAQNKDTLAVSRTIPTPIPGLTVTPGARITQETTDTLYEMMGNDLSHHVLSYVRLDELRDKAQKKRTASMVTVVDNIKKAEEEALKAAASAVATPPGSSRTSSQPPMEVVQETEAGTPIASEAVPLVRPISGLASVSPIESTSPIGSTIGSGSGWITAAGSNTNLTHDDIQVLKDEISDTSPGTRFHTESRGIMSDEGDFMFTTPDAKRKMRVDEAKEKAKAVVEAVEQESKSIRDDIAYLRDEFQENTFRKNQFFSTDAILNMVKDYHDFLDWKKGSPLVKQPNSGFVFYDKADIQEIAKNARKAESLAAGKSAFTIKKNEDGTEEAKKLEIRTALSEPLTDIASRDELAEFEQKMQLCLAANREKDPGAGLTPDDRLELLLNTEVGKKVFNSYTKIVGTYKELTGAVTTLLGYEGRLREEMPKFQAAHRMALTGKRVGAALKSTFDDSGLHPSPNAGTEAAKTLKERGYFALGKLRNYDELHHDDGDQSLNVWLQRHGLAKAENGLDGMKSLIVAALQHATGRYDNLHVEEAGKYLKKFDKSVLLSVDMNALIDEISRNHGGMQVHMIASDSSNNGAPAWIGDLGTAQQKDARQVVIMRSKNAEGKDTFGAVVHKKRAFAPDIPEHLKQLDKAKAARSVMVNDAVPGQNVSLTGVQRREGMKIVGVQQRGRISNLMKNVSASLADKKRPERKDLREMDDSALKEEVNVASGLRAGSTRYWREGIKEKKKRDDMKDMLNSQAAGRSFEEKSGKALRKEMSKEMKENGTPVSLARSTAQQMASLFKPRSKTAEVMTRLTRKEVEEAMQSNHPKIQGAAKTELDKRQKMESTLAEARNRRTKMQYQFIENQIQNLTKDREILISQNPSLAQEWRDTMKRPSRNAVHPLHQEQEPQTASTVHAGNNSADISNTGRDDGLRQMSSLVSANIISEQEQDELAMFGAATEATNAWFDKNNYKVAPSSTDQNNCLLIALLQHATGRYEKSDLKDLEKLARSIREELEQQHGIKQGAMLFAHPGSDDTELGFLIDMVSKKLGGSGIAQEQVVIVAPHKGGAPYAGSFEVDNESGLLRPMNDDELNRLKQQKVIVFGRDGNKHFEPVINMESAVQQ